MLQKPNTFLSVDLNALVHNYLFFKSKTKDSTKLVAVIKAFAYGHEAIEIAKYLESLEVDYFGVAYIQEGIKLRKAGIKTPIIVFHSQLSDIEECFKYQLEPSIYSFRVLNYFLELTNIHKLTNFPIHIMFNTGMNRLGFSQKDISQIVSLVSKNNNLKIASILSHLVASEDSNQKHFTQNQINLFSSIIDEFESQLPYSFDKHIANSTGVLNYSEAHFNMVRVGIGLYGYANDKKWTKRLRNVSKLHSIISQIHLIKKGESVGYNRVFKAEKKTISATISIGYADGIPRSWGNGVGYVTIKGEKAYILGNVTMDMLMVDVTNIACKEGDEVLFFETQEIVEDLALRTNTISYEVLTAISQRIPRIIVPKI